MRLGTISGSLTQLTDGTSYLIAGTNIDIVSESWGAVTISSTAGGGTPASPNDSVQFNDAGSFGGTSDFTYDQSIGRLHQTGSFSQGDGTVAIGDFSHAQGGETITVGDWAHAEGYRTAALNQYSHSEGELTEAVATGAHAEGLGTIASGSYQHAAGQYNQRDNSFSLMVVGNGTGDDNVDRSDVLRVNPGTPGDGRVEVTGSFVATTGLSGSLTQLANGSSYLVAGNNISIVSQSNGSVLISSSFPSIVYRPGGVDQDNVFTTWDGVMNAFSQLDGLVFIDIDDSLGTPTVSSGTHDLQSRAIIRGVKSGPGYPSLLELPDGAVIKNPREFHNFWLRLLGSTSPNFAFDVSDQSVHFRGTSYVDFDGATTEPFARVSSALDLMFVFRDDIVVNNYLGSFLEVTDSDAFILMSMSDSVLLNSDNFISGTGSLYFYHDSSVQTNFSVGLPTNPDFLGPASYAPLDNAQLMAYDDTIVSPALGEDRVQKAIDVFKLRWASSTANALYTTSSIAIRGNESSVDAATDKGNDVFFYVSGSISNTAGKSLFGGDVVVSGSLSLGSGSNLPTGIVYLDGGSPGSVTVTNSLITNRSMIFLTKQANNHPTAGAPVVSAKSPGSFTITTNHNGDDDPVAYLIINPANS